MKNYILLFICIFYLIPISYVYDRYNSNHSISSIICNKNIKYIILFFMGWMGILSILYEAYRNDFVSMIIITILVISVWCLIIFDEKYTIHKLFTFVVFIRFILFNLRHYYLQNNNIVLLLSLIVSIVLFMYILCNFNKHIFYHQVIYILNITFVYLYLHFTTIL